MTSLDTNVIVRFLTNDDPVQSPRARALLKTGPVWVSRTVLLETEWVLRSAYDIAPLDIVRLLRAFLGLAGVSVEDAKIVSYALDLADAGMDFADTLHLTASTGATGFATFDRAIHRHASDIPGLPPVIEP